MLKLADKVVLIRFESKAVSFLNFRKGISFAENDFSLGLSFFLRVSL